MKGLVGKARTFPRFDPLPLPQIDTFHDVLVRVSAIALTPAEAIAVRRVPLQPEEQFMHAHYFTGRVVQGNNRKFIEGDRVLGFTEHGNAAAEIVAVPGFRIEKVWNDNIQDAKIAGFAYDGFVAEKCFKSFERIEDFVLVLGADSPVGAIATAWAKFALKTRVHAVCRDSAKIRSLMPGPTRILEMNRGQPWHEALQDIQYDFILDCIGGHEIWMQGKHLLRPGGSFVSIFGDMFEPPAGISRIASEAMSDLFRNFKAAVSPGIGAKYEVFNAETTQYSIGPILEMLQHRKVQIPSFVQEFSIDEIGSYLEADTRNIRPVLKLSI
jgi:NADPH:quinone reductase-like Zn-dependent oxidoreductase